MIEPGVKNRLSAQRTWHTSVAVALLCVSIGLTIWFIAGSFVNHAQPVDATAMQNIYLDRIVRFGSISAVLQVATAIVLLFGRKAVV